MRPLAVIGVLLIVFGVIALGVQSVTFFTQERVVDAGPLQIDWQKPHTVIVNPIAGIASAVLGAVLLLASGRRSTMG